MYVTDKVINIMTKAIWEKKGPIYLNMQIAVNHQAKPRQEPKNLEAETEAEVTEQWCSALFYMFCSACLHIKP